MSVQSRSKRLRVRIVGLDCASCSRVINRALEGLKGVRNVGTSYMLDLMLIDYDPTILTKDEILAAIKETGYDAIPAAN